MVLLIVSNRNEFRLANVFLKKERFIKRILGHLMEFMKWLNHRPTKAQAVGPSRTPSSSPDPLCFGPDAAVGPPGFV